jgi:hypothetical protein
MRKFSTTLLVASAIIVGLAIVPGLYAQDAHGPSRSRMGHGMMGGMNMMGGMSQMMDHCNQMMGRKGGSGRPNEQWRQQTPETPKTPKTPEKKS